MRGNNGKTIEFRSYAPFPKSIDKDRCMSLDDYPVSNIVLFRRYGMSEIEHYFENLIHLGKDVADNANKDFLSKEVQEAVEECALHIRSLLDMGILAYTDIKADSEDKTSDLISRQAAIDALDCINGTEEVLRLLPSAQPERKKGKWIKVGHWGRSYKCNRCGNYLDFDGVNAGRGDANFCPNCGAEMRSEEEREELVCTVTMMRHPGYWR